MVTRGLCKRMRGCHAAAMRRLAIMERKKVRGVPRRLRALARWADQFAGRHVPRPARGDKYWNWKIPVYAGLVNPPTTTPALQGECMTHMLTAARHLAEATPAASEGYHRVACLFVLPWLYASEVAIYYDRDYYRTFAGRRHELAPRSLAQEFGLALPDGFVECGYRVYDEEEGVDEEWWCVGQPP